MTLTLDSRVQLRAVDYSLVDVYAELYGNGEKPAQRGLVLDLDGTLIIIDGQHRWFAAQKAGVEFEYDVVTQSLEEAIWLAAGANRLNGKRLSNAEKDEAVRRVLEVSPNRSDRDIARQVGVSDKTVAAKRVRNSAPAATPRADEQKTERPRPTQTPARVESAKKSNAKAREASVKKAKLTRPQRVYAAAIKALTKLGDDAEALRAVREQFNAYVDARLAELE